jgi:hypothetical protein
MDQYLESVSLEKIADVRNKITLRNTTISSKGDPDNDGSLDEENWEFLMIHTSKRVEEKLEIQ